MGIIWSGNLMDLQVLNKINETYIVEILNEMIKIPSIIGQEADFAEFLKTELMSMGFKTHLDLIEPGRPNVIGILDSNPNKPLIMFNGHLDTVAVCEGWTSDPFVPFLKNNRIYGLGSWDMKSGIACSLGALRALIDAGPVTENLVFSGVIDEEGYSKGARALLNTDLRKVDAVIIGEPYFGDSVEHRIPIGITGKILYEITVHGRSFHGFHPERGINAIDDAARIIASLDQLALGEHSRFGQGNICTIKIAGGYQNYEVTVPDRCTIMVNRLMVPGETKEGVLKEMRQYIDSLSLKSDVEVKDVPPFYDPYEIQRKEPLMRCFEEAYEEILGSSPVLGYRPGITDANVFMGEGKIPTINFGPKGDQYHGADEYVEVNSLLPVAKIQALTALKLIQNASR